MKYSLGRYVYGLAAIGFGICGVVWQDCDNSGEVQALGGGSNHEIFSYIVAIINILGGVAVLWPRTARLGALALAALYFVFALLDIPFIVRHPLIYNNWGNFFEPNIAFVAGAAILYACSDSVASARPQRVAQIGYCAFGICVASFALEQLFSLYNTASAVPKWIPPGQMFWAVATTLAFALAAIALLTGFMARLASQLTTAMLVGFALLVWAPALVADPRAFSNWTESLETLGIAGTALVVAELLAHEGEGHA